MAGLHLSELMLSHFRSHRAATLVMDGRPVAFFGPNGAGKTNVLEAVSLLSPGRGLRRAQPQDIARQPEGQGWKVSAVLRGAGAAHEVATMADPGAVGRAVRIDGKPASQAALGRLVRVLWLVPAMDRLWLDAAEGRRRFLDRMALSFDPMHGAAVLAYEKAMRERNRLFRDNIADPAWFGVLESQMAAAGARVAAARRRTVARLAAAQQGASTVFPAAALAILPTDNEPLTETEAEIEAVLRAGRRRDHAAGRALSGPHRADLGAVYMAKNIDAAQCSTGEQKALLISLILANARALSQDLDAPPILLLDEVAAHLDAERRAALYDEVCGMGAQAFLTGTEPALFASLGGRAQAFALHDVAGLSGMTETTLG